MTSREELLGQVCFLVSRAVKAAAAEANPRSREHASLPQFLIMRHDKVRVEILKENTNHHEPHIHVTHSDKIDASISIRSFEVLAGKIDRRTHKHLKRLLAPIQDQLQKIWDELNEKDNSDAAEKLINDLFL